MPDWYWEQNEKDKTLIVSSATGMTVGRADDSEWAELIADAHNEVVDELREAVHHA
jgi:hypothetical protein